MFLLLRVICYIYVIFYLNKLVIIIFPTYFKFIRLEMFSSVFACASKIFWLFRDCYICFAVAFILISEILILM